MSREVIRSINPFRCRMWALHDRLDAHITEESCKAEIASFERHGQMVPVLGRELIGDTTHDYELIYGARRLFVAQHLNVPLRVEVRPMTEREALVAMDVENRHRKDISPYERGMSYARMLRSGYFVSQDDLAKSLMISGSQVSRLLKLARLPSVVVNAFSAATEICEVWGLEIAEALEDPLRRAAVIHRARALAQRNLREKSETVYRELVLSGQPIGVKVRKPVHDEVVRDDTGTPLFRVRYHRNTVALILPMGKLSQMSLARIRKAVSHAIGTLDDFSSTDLPLPERKVAQIADHSQAS